MKIVIVTGMSGAGKSTALNVFEDEGYYCVDNMPIELIPKFIELARGQKKEYCNVALGVDIRSGDALNELDDMLKELSQRHYNYKILYLDSSDEVLVKRYKETRRTHPLAKDDRVDHAIEEERKQMSFLKERADYILDTSHMLTRELKQELEKIFVENGHYNNLFVTVLSFGFKYGIPADADLVFDVRFLPNPYYIEELKKLTGNDKPIQDYVMGFDAAHIFLDKIMDLFDFLLPEYVQEGKNSLVIAIGCTGGKHRSVTLANAIADRLKKTEYGCKVEHRDIDKDAIVRRIMSFSSEVKEELKTKTDTAKHCQIAEFAAMMAFGGHIHTDTNKKYTIVFVTENETVAAVFTELAAKIFGITENEIIKDGLQLIIRDEKYVKHILMTLKWLTDDNLNDAKRVFADPLIVQKDCCKRAFIKGAFLTAGSISDPNKFYHFEVVCDSNDDALQLQSMMTFFNLDAKITARKKNYIVYIKEGSHITDCLNVCGAYVSQMNLYNVMILKGMRNDVNRKVNCETANLNKTIEAAVKQIRDIEYIRDTVGLDYLKPMLRDLDRLRIDNQDMN